MFEAISQVITTPPAQGHDSSLATQGGAPKSSETPSAQKTADVLSASAQAAQADKKAQEQAQQVTEKMLRELEQDIEAIHSVGLRFAKFEELDRTYVKVIDKTNDKVIRQIPSEEVLKLAAKLEEMIGILFDRQA